MPWLLKTLRDAVGMSFTGWKGGEYVMRESTRLWVANPGDANSTGVTGITDLGYQVIINTAWDE